MIYIDGNSYGTTLKITLLSITAIRAFLRTLAEMFIKWIFFFLLILVDEKRSTIRIMGFKGETLHCWCKVVWLWKGSKEPRHTVVYKNGFDLK